MWYFHSIYTVNEWSRHDQLDIGLPAQTSWNEKE